MARGIVPGRIAPSPRGPANRSADMACDARFRPALVAPVAGQSVGADSGTGAGRFPARVLQPDGAPTTVVRCGTSRGDAPVLVRVRTLWREPIRGGAYRVPAALRV